MKALTTSEVGEWVELARSLGVAYLRVGELEFTLGPKPAPEAVNPVDKELEPRQIRRGKDGLTAEEQEAAYGKVMDSELLDKE